MSALTALVERVRTRAVASPRAATFIGLALLVGVSLLLRTQALHAKFWIDEGLSVGIASHDFFDIPSVLRKDGSPPLYYLLLHLWIEAFGDGEARTHALSLLFAVAMIPAAWWAGRELFGARTGWACAALAALNPFLTFYAQETRMYSLVALLSLLTVTTFSLGFALRRRRALIGFTIVATLLVLTHNWGLFLVAGTGVAWLVLARRAADEERRAVLRDGLLSFGGVLVLYAPWLPSLLSQARHTGAPWAERPPLDAVLSGLQSTLGGPGPAILLGAAGIAGVLTLRRAPGESRRFDAALSILIAGLCALTLTWVASQVSPAWANRYFAVFVGPILLILGAGLVRFGRFGLVVLAIALALWVDTRENQLKSKSNVFKVTRTLEDHVLVQPGDTILTTHPEQGPVLRYYLGPEYRYANALGPVQDPRVFDWRDALDRLEATGPRRVTRELVDRMPPGRRLILIQPIIRSSRWGADWTSLVRKRAAQWERELHHDPRLRRVGPVPTYGLGPVPRGVRAVIYTRR